MFLLHQAKWVKLNGKTLKVLERYLVNCLSLFNQIIYLLKKVTKWTSFDRDYHNEVSDWARIVPSIYIIMVFYGFVRKLRSCEHRILLNFCPNFDKKNFWFYDSYDSKYDGNDGWDNTIKTCLISLWLCKICLLFWKVNSCLFFRFFSKVLQNL